MAGELATNALCHRRIAACFGFVASKACHVTGSIGGEGASALTAVICIDSNVPNKRLQNMLNRIKADICSPPLQDCDEA